MKTLITHINPHLDDIFAIWLFKKYHPDFSEAQVEFISASHNIADETEDRIYIGTGGGAFDEHKEGLDSCAGTLVYEFLKNEAKLPGDDLTIKALEKLVDWNQMIDTGKAPHHEFDEFSVQAYLRPLDGNADTSRQAVDLGVKILDRILEVLKRKEQSILDWEKRQEFESKFGKGYAVSSETINREFCREQGGDLYIMSDPRYNSIQFFAPSKDISQIYEKVKQLDPDASWFLHQSHHMVLCGSGSSPEFRPTKLSMDELINSVKNEN